MTASIFAFRLMFRGDFLRYYRSKGLFGENLHLSFTHREPGKSSDGMLRWDLCLLLLRRPRLRASAIWPRSAVCMRPLAGFICMSSKLCAGSGSWLLCLLRHLQKVLGRNGFARASESWA